MHVPLCICALMPSLSTASRLVLLIHRREARKPTNTGQLAARALLNHEVHVIGEQGNPLDYQRLCPPEATNLCLFPAKTAVTLTPDFCASLERPVRLVVPDGNWGQAGRVHSKLPQARVTFVTLPEGPPTQYRLRRETREQPGGLATLEAIARALEVLEGPAVSAPLLEIFRIFVERTLWTRGKLPMAKVYGGIPGC
jgi:DTW domain-containing protein YfiP